MIIPLLPPTIAIVIDKQNAPKRPTLGSTPAIPEKAIASGIIAKATTKPERIFDFGSSNQFLDKYLEKVVGHELQGTTCVVLYEDTTAAEKYLPSTNQVSTTAAIAVVATAAAAATPLLLRVIKPIVKQLTKKVQKLLGKEPPKLSANEIKTNRYREKKGLGPFKRPKRTTTHSFGILRYFKKKK